MTTFVVNGKETELTMMVNGIDISPDFIGNTSHGMETDDDGRFLASLEDLEWWRAAMIREEEMLALIEQYKETNDSDVVDEVITSWITGDYETNLAHVKMGLERNFG